jgi:hypothetical protein
MRAGGGDRADLHGGAQKDRVRAKWGGIGAVGGGIPDQRLHHLGAMRGIEGEAIKAGEGFGPDRAGNGCGGEEEECAISGFICMCLFGWGADEPIWANRGGMRVLFPVSGRAKAV